MAEPRPARLAPDVVEDGAHIHGYIRHLRQHFAEAGKIVRVPSHVRGNEGRLRILAEQIVALLHQLLEVRMPGRIDAERSGV